MPRRDEDEYYGPQGDDGVFISKSTKRISTQFGERAEKTGNKRRASGMRAPPEKFREVNPQPVERVRISQAPAPRKWNRTDPHLRDAPGGGRSQLINPEGPYQDAPRVQVSDAPAKFEGNPEETPEAYRPRTDNPVGGETRR